jgi:uncharacterized protein YoxC
MDIHQKVGRIEGTLESVQDLGSKTHVQAIKTNGRVTALEQAFEAAKLNSVSRTGSASSNLPSGLITKYLDKALLIGAIAGAFIIGIIDAFR